MRTVNEYFEEAFEYLQGEQENWRGRIADDMDWTIEQYFPIALYTDLLPNAEYDGDLGVMVGVPSEMQRAFENMFGDFLYSKLEADNRAAFEKWIKSSGIYADVARYTDDGGYEEEATDMMFKAFQAGRAHEKGLTK